ncbi:MAG: hypothetical protein K0S65_291 [Labilithrix sp.]|nr:hypothetical protein [Labilithrix sp.]
MSTAESRGPLLERTAFAAARSWMDACCAELARDGRRVEGAWPGTMPEARTRAAMEARRALTERSMTLLTHDELEQLARITFDEARRSWRALAR